VIKSISFRNFRILRDATLPLRPLTLIVGPNGSGKSTALDALRLMGHTFEYRYSSLVPTGDASRRGPISIAFDWAAPYEHFRTQVHISAMANDQIGLAMNSVPIAAAPTPTNVPNDVLSQLWGAVARFAAYAFDPAVLIAPALLDKDSALGEDGLNFVAVLDRLRDSYPEKFDVLNEELTLWLPEFDKILFDSPGRGQRSFLLRTRVGGHAIPAENLSQGTLLALAIMTLAVFPHVPPLIAIEEPDRGIHPRLLRDVVNALRRLAYPAEFGIANPARQVIVTTHSPYMLDLFRDDLAEVVIAEKRDEDARFVRLADRPDVEEVLHDVHLGEAWYSGVLGGVPAIG
jgi:predicted ATPase